MLKLLKRLLGRGEARAPKQNPFVTMRAMALEVTRNKAGLEKPPDDAPVWGVVVEWYMATEVVLVVLSDGTVSMYLGFGGGVIGGQSHESVRSAGAHLIVLAN